MCTLFTRLVTPSHLTFLGTACGEIELMEEREEDGDSSLTFLSLALTLDPNSLFSLFTPLSGAKLRLEAPKVKLSLESRGIPHSSLSLSLLIRML